MPHSFAYVANEWVLPAAAVSERFHRTRLDFQRPFLKVDANQTFLATKVRTEAAPPPLVRLFHQSSLHRIAMHIAEFLDPLPLRPHIEIVEALLPDGIGSKVPERSLSRDALGSKAVYLPGKSLLITFITTEGSPISGSVMSK